MPIEIDWPDWDEPEPQVEFVRVLSLSRLPEDKPTLARAGILRIALVRRGDRVFAVKDACPHAGGSLASGELAGKSLICLRHGWAFDVETGACPEHPVYSARCYDVEIRDGSVYVGIPQEP